MTNKREKMFLIGAGASCPMGIPTMKGFTDAFERKIETEGSFSQKTVLERIKNETKKEEWDLESLLLSLRNVLSIEENMAFTLLGLQNSLEYRQFTQGHRAHYETVLNNLLEFIKEKCMDYDKVKASNLYGPLLDMSKAFKLHLFTTNYDSIIEDVCVSKNLEFEDGFASHPSGGSIWKSERLGKSDAINIYKLHGSVSWYFDERKNEIFKEPRHIGEIEGIRNMRIYPGETKGSFHPPYKQLFSEFVRVLYSAKECTVIGSSLRDEYLRDFLEVRLMQGRFGLMLISPDARRMWSNMFKSSSKVIPFPETFEKYI